MTKMHEPSAALPAVYIGLPMWQHPDWPACWFGGNQSAQLARYARQMNSVEGNTMFYSLPSAATLSQWSEAVGESFLFTFKFHQAISHHKALIHCEDEIAQQLNLLAPMYHQVGVMLLQLPAQFGPDNLPALAGFLNHLPDDLHVAVEVRHLAFFMKGDEERALNRLLAEHGANRIIMDTRALFSGRSDSALTAEVRTKKPRVPVNVIATGSRPVVRFVGNNNDNDNLRCLSPWIDKIHQWRCEGRTPFIFFHRPDNRDAPWLADQFIRQYNSAYPTAALPALTFPQQPDQSALF
ncbi:DUF72 domain-containing protein [Alteromonas sp. CYL-A6]|uniref:DUF72 domain-containing protein n=1 Tax=Alteromonas nitratireducens TaxID=3390813 RepID=UPI0034BA2CDD